MTLRSPRYILSVLAIAIALLLPGCSALGGSSDNAKSAEHWEGGDEPWLQPPGTHVNATLVVPEGAQLAGPTFALVRGNPQEIMPDDVTYHEAYLLVDGDMSDVVADLVSQGGGRRAFDVEGQQSICRQTVALESTTKEFPFVGELKDGAIALECSGFAHEPWDRPATADLYQDQIRNFELRHPHDVDAPFSFYLFQDLTKPESPAIGRLSWGGWRGYRDDRVVVTDSPLTPASGSGMNTEVLDPELSDRSLVVQPGSFMALPPLGPVPGYGDFMALIGVTGDPDEVFNAYVELFGAKVISTHSAGEVEYRHALFDEAGGDKWNVEMNASGDAAWIVVSFSHDA